jgi:hypothetical protein
LDRKGCGNLQLFAFFCFCEMQHFAFLGNDPTLLIYNMQKYHGIFSGMIQTGHKKMFNLICLGHMEYTDGLIVLPLYVRAPSRGCIFT